MINNLVSLTVILSEPEEGAIGVLKLNIPCIWKIDYVHKLCELQWSDQMEKCHVVFANRFKALVYDYLVGLIEYENSIVKA